MFSKYKELRETLQNQNDLLFDTLKFEEIPIDSYEEYKNIDSIEGKDLNIFINIPQIYENLIKMLFQMLG